MFIHLRGPHTGENGGSNDPLHRKIIYCAWFFGSLRYTSTDTGGRFLLKTRNLRMVFDVWTTLYIYAAHIQVKMASQLARYIEKQFILTVFFGACSTRLTDEGRHFYGRNATHSLSSMSAPLRPPMRPTYRWKLCLNCLIASENTEGFDVCSCSHI